jgi:hypothetical protein
MRQGIKGEMHNLPLHGPRHLLRSVNPHADIIALQHCSPLHKHKSGLRIEENVIFSVRFPDFDYSSMMHTQNWWRKCEVR